jgi:hypothetical protein
MKTVTVDWHHIGDHYGDSMWFIDDNNHIIKTAKILFSYRLFCFILTYKEIINVK